MNILLEIYEGWKNLIFSSPEIEELAKKRIEICVSNKCKQFKTRRKSCGKCGCYMPAKVRNPDSKCNLKLW